MAAVLFPHDIGAISFDDLYALGVPLFVPEQRQVENMAYAHLASTQNYPWYLLRQEHSAIWSPRRAQVPPWDPGWGWQESGAR